MAIVREACATVTDGIVDLHDRVLGRLFNIAKRKHQQQFQLSGKSINDKVRQFSKIGRASLKAKESGSDAFEAIETVMPWHAFTKSVTEAEQIAQPESFDFLHPVGDHFSTLRRYVPDFLDILKLRAAPLAKDVLAAVDTIRMMNLNDARKVPADAPTSVVKKRWEQLVLAKSGIDRRYYELTRGSISDVCSISVCASIGTAASSGDIFRPDWVTIASGSLFAAANRLAVASFISIRWRRSFK